MVVPGVLFRGLACTLLSFYASKLVYFSADMSYDSRWPTLPILQQQA